MLCVVFLAGNGGSNPRHATLFAKDVPPSKVLRILDRFLMYYIRTADKLMRTARWVEQFEGGIEVCRTILIFPTSLNFFYFLAATQKNLVGR